MVIARKEKAMTPMTQIMGEHVEMPGFPQLIVTRHFVYHWLRARGWTPEARGFGSLDYTTFGREASALPLTEEAERDYWLGQVESAYTR